MGTQKPGIPVSFYFDYNCPFCYVASHRLLSLRQRHDLDILWRFVEIHPGNDPRGQPLESLGYDQAQWRQMMENVEAMVTEDGLPWVPRMFTTNTRKAILLAQTVLLQKAAAFPAFHQALFHAYFAQGRNLGDEGELRAIAAEHGVEHYTETAWNTPAAMQVLLSHVEEAQRIGLSGVPTVVVSRRAFPGAVSVNLLEQALEEAAAGR
ncbi:MAG: DsbA family protein [Ectothiorhodospiraceae bacterium]|nr:DsbA family protein [Ectothiorhodospiraceae bacterium]